MKVLERLYPVAVPVTVLIFALYGSTDDLYLTNPWLYDRLGYVANTFLLICMLVVTLYHLQSSRILLRRLGIVTVTSLVIYLLTALATLTYSALLESPVVYLVSAVAFAGLAINFLVAGVTSLKQLYRWVRKRVAQRTE